MENVFHILKLLEDIRPLYRTLFFLVWKGPSAEWCKHSPMFPHHCKYRRHHFRVSATPAQMTLTGLPLPQCCLLLHSLYRFAIGMPAVCRGKSLSSVYFLLKSVCPDDGTGCEASKSNQCGQTPRERRIQEIGGKSERRSLVVIISG